MNISLTQTLTSEGNTCLVLPLAKDAGLDSSLQERLGETINGRVAFAKDTLSFSGDYTSTQLLPAGDSNSPHLLLVGLGDTEEFNSTKLPKMAQAIAGALKSNKISTATVAISDISDKLESLSEAALIEALVLSLENAHYNFDAYKSKKADSPALTNVSLTVSDESADEVISALNYGQALAKGVSTTKNLGNEPGNVCTPTYLAEQAEQLAKDNDAITTKVLDESELEALNMGAFISVSKGSSEPGKLITMQYQGDDSNSAPYVLVGKGITFDTGGISLKPGASMDEMKYDMCGAASVIGVMTAIAELKPKLNFIGVIAAAENMPAGHASKPGDIVTTASGQTVEILNTDAEGRLVLCDTLTYVEQFEPAAVVDIATLTGACIIALGHHTSAVMGNNDDLIEELLDSGQDANDRAWPLPIWDEYQAQIDSPFADMQNIGGKGAGSITAACFLSKFTKKYPWAHMDIAGTAWVSGGMNKGATGRPVPLLLKYLMSKAS